MVTIKDAQAMWAWGGRNLTQLVHDRDLPTVFNPTFVQKSAGVSRLFQPVHRSILFSSRREARGEGLSPDEQSRLPVCRECKDARQVRDDNTVAFSLTTL